MVSQIGRPTDLIDTQAKRKLDPSKLQCAPVGASHVAKYKTWGTTAGRDMVVRVDYNAQVADDAIHKPLSGALKETHPAMKRERICAQIWIELSLISVSPRLKA